MLMLTSRFEGIKYSIFYKQLVDVSKLQFSYIFIYFQHNIATSITYFTTSLKKLLLLGSNL